MIGWKQKCTDPFSYLMIFLSRRSRASFQGYLLIFMMQKGSKNVCKINFWNILTYTLTRKNMNLPYSIRMYWTNSWQPTVHVQQTIFEKSLIEVGSSHLYASFGTFCVQIGRLLEAQWVFEKCMKTVKSLFSTENDVDFEFFWRFKVSLCLE